MGEQLTYSVICDFRMTCYEIVVDSEQYLAICNFRTTCYDIAVDSEWMVDLYYDL